MVRLWTNFATYHNPTPDTKEWPSVKGEAANYVRLQESMLITFKDEIRDTRLTFWPKIFKQAFKKS